MMNKGIGLGVLCIALLAGVACAGNADKDAAPMQAANDLEKSGEAKVGAKSSPVLVATSEQTVGADGFRVPEQKQASTATIAPLGSDKSPHDVAMAAEKGSLKNPYSYKEMNPVLVELGRKKYMSVSCNGCHGGTGGGGMCPPLSNSTWVYGSDDDTLFRLVALGSDELQKLGYTRKGRENVVGPMPPHGKIVKTEDDLWRIIYFIRGNFRGDSKDIKW